MRFFTFLFVFFLLGCSAEKNKFTSFQECTVFYVSKLQFRGARGLLSKSCYLKYDPSNGNTESKIGDCLLKSITKLRSIEDGEFLINNCSKNKEISDFLLEVLNDD